MVSYVFGFRLNWGLGPTKRSFAEEKEKNKEEQEF